MNGDYLPSSMEEQEMEFLENSSTKLLPAEVLVTPVLVLVAFVLVLVVLVSAEVLVVHRLARP